MSERKELEMTWLDRAVVWAAPTLGARRLEARERLKLFGYDAANPGRKRGRSGGMGKNASSESARMARDRISLMWEARDLVRNFAILRGIVSRVVQYVADNVQYVSQTGDDRVDAAHQDYFHEWCKRCDITERHRLGDLVWMLIWGILVDGDMGWNLVEVDVPSDGKVLRIQPVEADRIGDPMVPCGNDPHYFSGVKIDDVGRVEHFSIYSRDRESKRYRHEGDVPPEHFIHVFNPDRVDQYRGVTALATAIAPARDLYEAYDFELQAAKWQGSHAGFVRQSRMEGGLDAWSKEDEKTGVRSYEMQAGRIQKLLMPGEEVIFAPSMTRPGGAFMALVQVLVREIAQGINMPYGFCYDMSAFSGHTGRVEIAQANRGIRRWQKLIEERGLLPVRDAVLSRAILLEEIPPHPRWQSGRFGWGRTLSGDYGHDTSANLSLMNAGIITASDLIAEMGNSFEDVRRRQAGEVLSMQKLAGQTGVPIELMTQAMPNATAALAAMNQPPPEPVGLVGEGMDVKPLVEILKQVGEGVIDRESAIAQLMQLYALDRLDAEAMVPDQGKREDGNGAGAGGVEK